MRIVACGDAIVASRGYRDRVDPAVLDLLAEGDAVFANAEFTCPGPDTPPAPRPWVIGVGPWAIDELRSTGVDLISFANNCAGGFGPQGVRDTIDALTGRDVAWSGIGRTLGEARAAAFRDNPEGRVALISVATTGSDTYLAGDALPGVAARAGLNPLRWSRSYVLDDADYAAVQAVADRLGSGPQQVERAVIENSGVPGGKDYASAFVFGSAEAGVVVERGARTEVVTSPHADDLAAIGRAIRDARGRADRVLVSLHAHEGREDGWYAEEPADFVAEAARAFIDAGADAVLGHGPHMLRGVEVHRGRPILYSLGTLFFDMDMLERISPEMYRQWDLPPGSMPWDLHSARAYSDTGELQGLYGDSRVFEGIAAVLSDADGEPAVTLVPLLIDNIDQPPHRRGLPRRARGAEAAHVLGRIARMSEVLGTSVRIDAEQGVAYVDGVA